MQYLMQIVLIKKEECHIWCKVIYNIGTEILLPTSNLHNSTLRGRTETIFGRIICYFLRSIFLARSQGCSDTKKNWFVWLCSLRFQKNMDFCRRRHNKLKLLRSKNQWYMIIRPFISMKSICSCVFSWSRALKTIMLMSF